MQCRRKIARANLQLHPSGAESRPSSGDDDDQVLILLPNTTLRVTMRFSTVALLAVLAPAASGFVLPTNRQNAGVAVRTNAPLSMAIEDLESKLLNPDEFKKSKKEKPAPKPKPEKKAPEPKKPSKKEIEAEAKAKAEELKRVAEFEKAAAEKKVEKKVKTAVKEVKKEAKALKYSLDTDLDKPKKPRVKKDSPLPKAPSISIKAPSVSLPKLPKPSPKPTGIAKPSAPADPNVGPLGVALGAAPLIAVPVIGLAAARGALSKTAARRAQIQKEIAAAEEAKKKKALEADVDPGTLAKATVCIANPVGSVIMTNFLVTHHCVCFPQAFLGAGVAAIGLVVTAPFANIDGPSLPSISSGNGKPAVEKVVKAKSTKPKKGPKGYNLDVGDDVADARRAARAEAKAAKKAAAEKLAAEKAAAKAEAAAAAKAAKEEGMLL